MSLQEQTKSSFRSTIDTIRGKLLEDLRDATERRYSLSVKDRSKVDLRGLAALQYTRLQPHLKDLPALVKERAYTLTNRLVILMSLEARGLRKVKFQSFRNEQEFFVELTQGDDAGLGFVLQQVWDQLALELPALFAYDEVLECIPVSGPTLLWLMEQLNAPELAGAWLDDTTLGWLYQYWNDPDRKAVDEKLNTTTGKVEAHELANKTQLFTERYMVEWLVQNSLGAQWLAICAKQGKAPQAQEVLQTLATRRADWNARIEQGTEMPTTPMPVQGVEEFWKYYVPQELSADAIRLAPDSLQQVKVLDPAMGSGHFLVYVFDFLWVLYQDQARLIGVEYTAQQVLTWILTQNLHGIDIDNRAVQIGAAALYIKVQQRCAGFAIPQLNLVASDLGLAHLKSTDPAVLEFATSLETELGLPKSLSFKLVDTLRGADYMGSLLQIDSEIDRMISGTKLFGEEVTGANARDKVLVALRKFVHDHDQGEDLGLGNLAEQLGKGLRLIELLGQKYEVIVANPPYLGTSKLENTISSQIQSIYVSSKIDLYTMIMQRSLELLNDYGQLAVVTMRNWMFLEQFHDFRTHILRNSNILKIADLGICAFGDMTSSSHISVGLFVISNSTQSKNKTTIIRPILGKDVRKDSKQIAKYLLGLLAQKTSYTFPQERFAEIQGAPMIYWWPEEFRAAYLNAKKLGTFGEVRQGLASSNNNRFVRAPFEVSASKIDIDNAFSPKLSDGMLWCPYVKGATGKRWFEPITDVIVWNESGKIVKAYASFLYGSATRTIKSQDKYFQQGLAFSYIGTNGFLCRLRKYKSIFDVSGSSIFCDDPEKMQVILSSNLSGYVSQSLNPTVNNQVGDIANLPVFDLLADLTQYLKRAEALYDKLFASTESNLEYNYQHLDPATFEVEEARIRDEIDKEILAHFSPATVKAIYQEIGESIFDFPQWDNQDSSIPADFAQSYQASETIEVLSRQYRLHPDSILAIKHHLGLVHENQRIDEAFKHLSWAIGVLLGRFTASVPSHLHGLLYLSALDDLDGLEQSRKLDCNVGSQAIASLQSILTAHWGEEKAKELWKGLQDVLAPKSTLGEYIRTDAFAKHKEIYENRPIYFPLVSSKKNFFVWVNIHQWNDGTLNSILANYLRPDLNLLEARIRRLREDSLSATDKKVRNALENEVARLDKWLDELREFIAKVTQLAEKGPAPKLQEVEAPYVMDLDDGVMVNSASLWELVQPLWKDPKKWWDILSKPAGKKDFDWSHLAMRYWPNRVMEKVKKDPSLAVAHSDYGAYKGRDLFVELHPAAAKKWEEQQKKGNAKDLAPEFELGVEDAE